MKQNVKASIKQDVKSDMEQYIKASMKTDMKQYIKLNINADMKCDKKEKIKRDNKANIRCMALIILLFAAVVAGCGNKEDQSVAAVRSGGVLRVAVPDTPSVLLYQDEETGDYQGEEAELTALIAEALGVSVLYLPADKQSLAGKLSIGEADIAIGSIMDRSSLTRNCLCSTSYGSGCVFVVTLRGLYVGDLSVFTDKVIGVSTQLAPESVSGLYAVDGIVIQNYDNIVSVSTDLAGGKIAGYVCYQPEAEALLELGDYQVQDAAGIDRENYVILAPAESAALMEGIDTVVRQYLTEAVSEPEE